MNCAEAEELVGAYALDALPADEAAQFRAHIAGCRLHAAKAAELRAVASALPASVDAMPPSPALRARMLDAIAREPQLASTSVGATRGSPVTGRTPTPISPPLQGRGQGLGAPWRSVRPLQAWGALAAAIIAALLVWNVALQSGGEDSDRFAAVNATSISALQAHNANGTGTALYFDDEDTIVVVADDIDQLDASRTFQLWALVDGSPVSLGTMLPDADGRMRSVVPFDVTGADSIAITVEPAAGSEQPTTDPVFTAELRS